MKTTITLVQVLMLAALVEGQSRTCAFSGDCASTQCCLRTGKSRTCAARGDVGSECSVANDALLSRFASSVFTSGCPCKDGYTCHRNRASSVKGELCDIDSVRLRVCTSAGVSAQAIPGK